MLSAREIPPGESGIIDAEIDTRGMEGRYAKSVFVETNDPRNNQSVLTLTAQIRAEMSISPHFIYFGTVRRGLMVERIVDIVLRNGSLCKIENAECTDKYVDIQTRVLGNGRGGLRVIAILRDNAPIGSLISNIIVKTSSHAMPRIIIPIRGVIIEREEQQRVN